MHKFMEILVFVLAIIGLAAIVKHITMNYEEGCWWCNWCVPKEDKK